MKILIAEDEEGLRKMLCRYFANRDHEPVPAENGSAAWEILRDNHEEYDMVLSDINMPGLDGLTLLEKIHVEEMNLPVVMMTAYAELEFTLKALRLGATDFLLKPFKLARLESICDRVSNLITSREAEKEVLPRSKCVVEMETPSRQDLTSGVVKALQNHYAPYCRVTGHDVHRIGVCLLEALSNAVIHGNLQVESSLKEEDWEAFEDEVRRRQAMPEYSSKKVSTRGEFSMKELVFEIRDEGEGFNSNNLPDPNDPESLLCSGRGLLIIQSFMDEVGWNEDGNFIRMVKNLEAGP